MYVFRKIQIYTDKRGHESERERPISIWDSLKDGKEERKKWYNYAIISKDKNIICRRKLFREKLYS